MSYSKYIVVILFLLGCRSDDKVSYILRFERPINFNFLYIDYDGKRVETIVNQTLDDFNYLKITLDRKYAIRKKTKLMITSFDGFSNATLEITNNNGELRGQFDTLYVIVPEEDKFFKLDSLELSQKLDSLHNYIPD